MLMVIIIIFIYFYFIQSVVHDKAIPSILHLEYEEGFIENSKEILMAVDYNEFILPYRCNVGKLFIYYFLLLIAI